MFGIKWFDYGLLKTAKTEKCCFSWRIVSPTPGSTFGQFGGGLTGQKPKFERLSPDLLLGLFFGFQGDLRF